MKIVAYCLLLFGGLVCDARAQAVAVSLQLDTNVIVVGGTTMLRVFAQVTPSYRTNADRIFSWYVNVLNTNGTVAQANYTAMSRSTSDKDPSTSSSGFTTNASRFGIYDTFLNLPGAGVTNPVELLSIPIAGAAPGLTALRVQAGSGVPALSEDFIVAPLGGGSFWSGGDFSAAVTNLQVLGAPSCSVVLHLASLSNSLMLLTFAPCTGYNHTVESTTMLVAPAIWQPLPGAPHNSGGVLVTNTGLTRFFRVRQNLPPQNCPLALHLGLPANNIMLLTFTPCPGYNHTVEFATALTALPTWQPLPGAPHNSGSVLVTNIGPARFFRVRSSLVAALALPLPAAGSEQP